MSTSFSFEGSNHWALILGGSSGFGLASAKRLSRSGMNICIVHRDRRGAMGRIDQEFDEIKSAGVKFKSFNLDALSVEGRAAVLSELPTLLEGGKIRLLLHSIAFGSLKLIAPEPQNSKVSASKLLAEKLNVPEQQIQLAIETLQAQGDLRFSSIAADTKYESDLLLEDDELAFTIYAMGTSLLSWTKEIFKAGNFSSDARVIGLTSEGNEIAWRGYAAVSAAKAALEAVSRSIAREFAPHGIRSNIVQPGVTDTPALRMIPGSSKLCAQAVFKNPFGRLTSVDDVANVIALLATDEAAWINGSIIRVDGGEHISG